ncbi:MAG: Na(+)/H(+) antiporter subunit D [Deltaproteobacteria bacterium]|nr:Na(+)/H(+) antiporter subunit D [Deltaproteobacteria bacterium]MBW1923049.1 Na(+)/H(+) antiporter subunit D [Deltaproteobacteria bacterium]MBW1949082.1 Na(+)/H(+) antiporter subunit D [Deltaproteobacteria bacterium]MBW2008246.1 Na(+)/H(+) antiporter subunit D [Deltaproteobacteria bacterium]RLB40995.1 MAG: Na(+)/H(+) antiporter subunit D [Deltaproteobacteria bacterium]
MIDPVPPALVFVAGALLVPFFKGNLKRAYLLALPVISFINLVSFSKGVHWTLPFLDYELVLARVDGLSLIFGYIFHLISFIAIIYALHVEDDLQHVAGLVYAGSAVGVVFSGDLFTFFVFWEMLTVASIFLIWTRRTRAAAGAGFRYLLVHSAGGLCLLAGIVLHVNQTGSISFDFIGLGGPGSYLIFLGFGLNCAWPVLHPWLTDAYPEATITGTIFLSAFTTKAAVYALARAFPGTGALIWIGAAMTCFPIFYAVIENDLRRVLAYSLINQVGFMVCGIGIGTHLAINGAVAHAFNDILFKALLFMAMGAVMYRTGKINGTDLGGLYRTMPLTCIFCMVGAASISAFPLFSGFVSKSMVMEAAAEGHMRIVWFMLLFASAGVFHHAGIKIPYFAFFSHDSGLRPREAPTHMLTAMGLTAALCIFIGSFPGYLYGLLPYPVEYVPYTAAHVVSQTQLLFFSALAFTLLLLSGIYPAEMRCVNLDADWFYRKGGRLFLFVMDRTFNGLNSVCDRYLAVGFARALGRFSQDAVARLSVYALASLWALVGVSGTRLEVRKRKVYENVRKGTLPVGLGAAMAAVFIMLLFLLSR